MDFLNTTIQAFSEFLRTLGGDTASLPLVLLFVAVFLGVLVVPRLVTARGPVERRLAPATQPRSDQDAPSLRPAASVSLWGQLLEGLEKRAVHTDEKKRTTLRTRLMQAGFMGPNAVRNYYAIRLLLTVGLPLSFLFLAPVFARNMPVFDILVVALGLGIIAFLFPAAWISHRIRTRQRAIQVSFPDALDMLMVCVEAGLGLDSAFSRVGAQMASAHPILAEQFGLVSLELRAGKQREVALRNMAERTGLPEITSFVVLLIQSDQLGTSIAQTLRIQAEEMRAKRMLRAEEKAYMLSVKLSVVLVIFLLPSMVLVVMLPAIIRIVRHVIPALVG